MHAVPFLASSLGTQRRRENTKPLMFISFPKETNQRKGTGTCLPFGFPRLHLKMGATLLLHPIFRFASVAS